MRKNFNMLSVLVEHEMKRDLLEGDLFLSGHGPKEQPKLPVHQEVFHTLSESDTAIPGRLGSLDAMDLK